MCNFFNLLFRKKSDKNNNKNNKNKHKHCLVATPVFNYDISNNLILNDLPPMYTPLIN